MLIRLHQVCINERVSHGRKPVCVCVWLRPLPLLITRPNRFYSPGFIKSLKAFVNGRLAPQRGTWLAGPEFSNSFLSYFLQEHDMENCGWHGWGAQTRINSLIEAEKLHLVTWCQQCHGYSSFHCRLWKSIWSGWWLHLDYFFTRAWYGKLQFILLWFLNSVNFINWS